VTPPKPTPPATATNAAACFFSPPFAVARVQTIADDDRSAVDVAVAVVIISLLFLIQQTEETVRSWWVIAARPGNLQGSGLFFSFRKRRGEEIERGRLPCLPL
jgi:hypothetical protein